MLVKSAAFMAGTCVGFNFLDTQTGKVYQALENPEKTAIACLLVDKPKGPHWDLLTQTKYGPLLTDGTRDTYQSCVFSGIEAAIKRIEAEVGQEGVQLPETE